MIVKENVEKITQAVKQLAKQEGAVLVGVGNVERWEGAPRGHGPRDFVPKAKSVVSVAQPILNAVIEAPAAMMDKEVDYVPLKNKRVYQERAYNVVGHRMHDYMLEHIGQVVGQYLQGKGYYTMVFPTTGSNVLSGLSWEESTKIWEDGRQIPPSHTPYGFFGYFFGDISHRHAAVRCGLGEFGYNNIVLTKQFGPRQRFNTIVTEAELKPDPLVSKPICLRDKCNLCLKACPTGAIKLKNGFDKDQIFIDTPSRTDPRLCVPRRGESGCFYGDCNRVCPIGKPRYLSKRLRSLRMGPI